MRLEDLLDRLQEYDLLLDTDPKFPSVTGFVAGATGGHSWWAHPQAKQMYGLSCGLRDHPDVLLVKLISGKLTFVHRPLWPAIVAIGMAREPWQMDGLSKGATALLKKTDGLSATGTLPWPSQATASAAKSLAGESLYRRDSAIDLFA